MAKAHIAELFAKERTLRLPFIARSWIRIAISERVLRSLVTGLIALFLVAFGVAITAQLVSSRDSALAEHKATSTLIADLAAARLRTSLAAELEDARIPRPLTTEDIRRHLVDDAFNGGRIYALADDRDVIRATAPEIGDLERRTVQSLLAPGAASTLRQDGSAMVPVTLPDGGEAFAALRDLAPYPSVLLLIQPRTEMLATWFTETLGLITLFVASLAVVTLVGAAFHWQSSRAAEADRTLAVATERLDKALDRGRAGLWDWDIARGHIFWSRSMFDILGLPPRGDLLSYSEVAERLHPDDKQMDRLVDELLRSGRTGVDQEFRMRHADGHWVWLRARAELASAPGEAAPHLVGITIDITEQKIADKLNQEAELRLRDAIENISEAFVLWDTDNRLVMCNSKYQQFHNLPASVCQPGTAYDDVTRAAKDPVVRQRLPIANIDPAEGNTFEVQLEDSHWLQINERRTKDGGFVSVGTDITPLKQHEERLVESERELMNTVRDLQRSRLTLEQQSQRLADLAEKYAQEKTRAETANRSKSEFLANMSHELRTPLNAIIGFSEVMKSEMLGPIGTEKYVEYARDIHGSGQYLLDVISDILDMSKIEAGRLQLEMGDCDLIDAMEDSLRIVAPRAEADNVVILRALPESLGLTADKRALKQVLINLLANAVKFTPTGGEVRIAAAGGDEDITVTITDTGIGIPAGDIDKLGRPFEQVENQLTKTKAGSGLGLAISRSLIELHHGTLDISSRQGEGTTVTVTLPRDCSAETPQAEPIPAAATQQA